MQHLLNTRSARHCEEPQLYRGDEATWRGWSATVGSDTGDHVIPGPLGREPAPRWAGLALLMTLVCWIAVACGSPDVPPELRALEELERGMELEALGNIERAFESYNSALRLDRTSAEAYVRRGHILLQAQRHNPAMGDFNRALELDPDMAEAYNYRGLILAESGRLESALLEYAKSIELDPGAVEPYLNRGSLYVEQGELDAALNDLGSAVELDPQNAGMYLVRARVHMLAGNTDRAAVDLEQVLSMTQDEALLLAARQLLAAIR